MTKGKWGKSLIRHRNFEELGIEILWYQFGEVILKTQGGVGI